MRLTPEQTWNVASFAAIGALAIIAAYDLLAPKPKAAMTPMKIASERTRITIENQKLEENVKKAEILVGNLTWTGSAEQIGSTALTTVTNLSRSKGLNLLIFRPQRTIDDGSLVRHPYSMTVEGPYPGLVSFLKSLETPANKLAVSLVQVATADPSSDRVSATVGLVAYRRAEKVTK